MVKKTECYIEKTSMRLGADSQKLQDLCWGTDTVRQCQVYRSRGGW
jgi:hypothetical protein